jgi:hypothetical protein
MRRNLWSSGFGEARSTYETHAITVPLRSHTGPVMDQFEKLDTQLMLEGIDLIVTPVIVTTK